jgi:hypothetical protein
MRGACLSRFGKIALVLAGLGLSVSTASARPMTEEEVSALVPDKDRDGQPIQRYRWSDKAEIHVSVITDGQKAACVSAAIKQIKSQIDLVRREIPSLRLAPDLKVMDTVPARYQPAMLLIALPTENEESVKALEAFARQAMRNATFVGEPTGIGMGEGVGRPDDPFDAGGSNSFEHADILAVDGGYAVYGHAWSAHKRGIELETGRCGWSWGDSLLELLGADSLYFFDVRDWQDLFGAQERRKVEFGQRVRREFLRALYEQRDETVDMNMVRQRFRALINDPKFPTGPDDASK